MTYSGTDDAPLTDQQKAFFFRRLTEDLYRPQLVDVRAAKDPTSLIRAKEEALAKDAREQGKVETMVQTFGEFFQDKPVTQGNIAFFMESLRTNPMFNMSARVEHEILNKLFTLYEEAAKYIGSHVQTAKSSKGPSERLF